MRLTSLLVERTLSQYDARLVPENHPAVPRLIGMFGDHTFFLDANGLNIVEPTDSPRDGVQAARVVEIAHWTDANPPNLAPHYPEPTKIVIELEADHWSSAQSPAGPGLARSDPRALDVPAEQSEKHPTP